ncbi:MAG: putative DNA binding domain-containing protein [Alphaproteobacteria bacterium]|nr:putative DNA binding domain-containing protein [Alphaproteobacteria bacterium]
MLNDQKLAELFRDLETDRVERKETAKDTGKIAEAICAFANDLPRHEAPGVVFVGVDDNGNCANLVVTDEMLRNLAGLRGDGRIQPFPVMTVQKHTIDGCDMLIIEVEPSDNPPVRYNGRCWIRVGPRRAQASAEEERRLVEKRRWGNLPFDRHGVVGATIAELDLRRFQNEYLPAAIAHEVLAENHRQVEDQLAAMRFLTREAIPTNTAILVIGIDPRRWLPGAYIQFVRFDGHEIVDPIKDQKEIGGTLADQLRQIDEVLHANIAVAADLSTGREVRLPNYPIAALQELIRNAVLHRTYEGTNAPVRVYWYSDRIEITNPGGLYGNVTPENFSQPGVTDYRNPTIAEAMWSLGYVQRFGMGIARARTQLKANGNPEAEFAIEPTHILVTLRPRP